MKQVFLFVMITACLLSCNSEEKTTPVVKQTEENPVDAKSEENIALVKKYITAIESSDTVAMASMMADNYRGYGPSIGDSASKAEAMANWKDNIDHYFASIHYNRFQNIAVTIKDNTDNEPGDWVSNWAYCTITFKDKRGPITVWVNAVYKIENGKIVKSRIFYNEADILRQLKYKIIAPNKIQAG